MMGRQIFPLLWTTLAAWIQLAESSASVSLVLGDYDGLAVSAVHPNGIQICLSLDPGNPSPMTARQSCADVNQTTKPYTQLINIQVDSLGLAKVSLIPVNQPVTELPLSAKAEKPLQRNKRQAFRRFGGERGYGDYGGEGGYGDFGGEGGFRGYGGEGDYGEFGGEGRYGRGEGGYEGGEGRYGGGEGRYGEGGYGEGGYGEGGYGEGGYGEGGYGEGGNGEGGYGEGRNGGEGNGGEGNGGEGNGGEGGNGEGGNRRRKRSLRINRFPGDSGLANGRIGMRLKDFVDRISGSPQDVSQVGQVYPGVQTINLVTAQNIKVPLLLTTSCSPHYHGPDCTRYCKPRVTADNGYYTCDRDGRLVCQTGYSGARCNVSLESCQPNPCVNGLCQPAQNGSKVRCECGSGYTGTLCDTPTDPCSTNPCVNGNCQSSPDGQSFVCDCFIGSTGTLCETSAFSVRTLV